MEPLLSYKIWIVIARYVSLGGGSDSEEDPATLHQFLSYHQGITYRLVVVLIIG
jgi:hypothetical protein